MIYRIFSVWDTKTEAYMQPFFSPTIGSGMRAFSDACRDPNTMLQKHPEDFILFEIGDFDDSTGVVQAAEPKNLGHAHLQEASS